MLCVRVRVCVRESEPRVYTFIARVSKVFFPMVAKVFCWGRE